MGRSPPLAAAAGEIQVIADFSRLWQGKVRNRWRGSWDLEHSRRFAATSEPKRRQTADQPQGAARRVEEDDVELEQHPEGVDAAAARDQQARSGSAAAQQ